jgi:ribonuclease D
MALPESSTPEEISLPTLLLPRVKSHLLDNQALLDDAVSEIKKSNSPVAIDAERASGFKYSQRAYLIQFRTEDSDIFLLDPVALEVAQLGELTSVLKDREWIIHAATQDLPCLDELNFTPGALFDTELAARILGLPRVGLGSLTEQLLNLKLAKEHSAADWSTRPLPESWLTYAALDVDVLHELRTELEIQLDSKNKLNWASQEFESLLNFKPKAPREEKWRFVKGANKITERSKLEIVRRLWEAREELARKIDVGPGRLIPDSSIIAAAEASPKTRPELQALRAFSGRASRSYLDTWWEAISSAYKSKQLPDLKPKRGEGIPNHRNWSNKFPEAAARLSMSKDLLTKLSVEIQIPLENLLTPDFLRRLCFEPPTTISKEALADSLSNMGARAWQVELVTESLVTAFSQVAESLEDPPSSSPPE